MKRLIRYGRLVRLSHTVFALPFALMGLCLAQSGWPDWATLGWVVGAMIGGRTYAMGLNRLMDRTLDAQNPRTQSRDLPSHHLGILDVWGLTLVALGLMIYCTLHLPPICVVWLPVAVGLLSVYSWMKRISPLAHGVLGLCLGITVVAGWLARTGIWAWEPVWLGLGVLFWVSGFDMIYACQDIQSDRALGLHSVPAWLGPHNTLWLVRLCHGLALSLWGSVMLWWPQASWGYATACLLASLWLLWGHSQLRVAHLARDGERFLMLNTPVSVVLLAGVLWDMAR